MADFYIDEYQDYVEDICIDHKMVNHGQLDSAGQALRSFSRFQSDEHIRQIQNNGGPVIVVVADYYGQRILNVDDDRARQTVQLRFAAKRIVGTGDVTNEINEANKKAMKVMFDFMSRFVKDASEQCEGIGDLEAELMTWDKIEDEPWLDDYYGWDLTMPFRSFLPGYDTTQWRSEE